MSAQAIKSSRIVVIGSTGNQGGAVIRKLASAGYTNLAAVVRPASIAGVKARAVADLGVELVEGSFEDQKSLAAAFAGAHGVYFVTLDGPQEIVHGQAVIDACLTADVKHVVFSAVVGATEKTGVPNFESKGVVQNNLASSQLKYSVVQPHTFFQLFEMDYFRPRDGLLCLPMKTSTTLTMVSTSDIANFVELAFSLGPDVANGKVYEAVGDKMTITELAEAVSRVAGHPLAAQEIPKEPFGPELGAMFSFLEKFGDEAQVDFDAVEKTLGRPLQKFEDYLATVSWPADTWAAASAAQPEASEE